MRITIMGTGYVGLVSDACLADLGHDVLCLDIDDARTAASNNGRAPIYQHDFAAGPLRFDADAAESVASEVCLRTGATSRLLVDACIGDRVVLDRARMLRTALAGDDQ